MQKTIPIKLYSQSNVDIAIVREVADNPDLDESKVFFFGPFLICASGRNFNSTELDGEAQRTVVKAWAGLPIYYGEIDHDEKARNQVARIYDAWTEERNGRTETWGKGYGIWTNGNKDLFDEIDGKVKKEMSCGIDVSKSVCSVCAAEIDLSNQPAFFGSCPNGHTAGQDGCYFRDVEWQPVHLAFVGRPGIEGAGLTEAASEADTTALRTYLRTGKGELAPDLAEPIQSLRRQAAEGQEFREWAEAEFRKWYRSNHPSDPSENVDDLASRLTAREMVRLARIERDRFHELVGDGSQQTFAEMEDEMTEDDNRRYRNEQEILKERTTLNIWS